MSVLLSYYSITTFLRSVEIVFFNFYMTFSSSSSFPLFHFIFSLCLSIFFLSLFFFLRSPIASPFISLFGSLFVIVVSVSFLSLLLF